MLKTFITILVFTISFVGFTQTDHDKRLLERYSAEELTALQNNNPEEYEIITHALKVGISIGDIQHGKDKEIQFDGVLDKDPSKEHTYISLGVELIDRYQYFRFKGTEKLVIVRPKQRITQIK